MLLDHRYLSGLPRFYRDCPLGCGCNVLCQYRRCKERTPETYTLYVTFNFKTRSSVQQVYRRVALFRWMAPESLQG